MAGESRKQRSRLPLWLGLLLGLGIFAACGFGESPPPAGGAGGGPDHAANAQHPRKRRRASLLLVSNLLIASGVLLILVVGGLYAYDYYEEQRARADPWLQQVQAAWLRQTPQLTATAAPTAATEATSIVAQPTTAGASPTTAPSPTPAATPAPPVHPPAVGIRIPSIGVDSRVVAVGVKNGEYEVPKFYVGHYQGTAQPGERGNGVYSGHVESAQSGNVFANLGQLKLGQDILLYTEEGIWQYRVSETKTVRNNDLSVMAATPDYRITLVTCAGTFNLIERQYSHRFIVVAELVNTAGPRLPGLQDAQ